MKNIFIHKVAGQKKDAVRVNNEADIPVFLQDSIIVNGDKLTLICVEGVETAPLGVVVGYEKSNSTPTGFNCWVIGNADTNLVEIDGVFYKKATVLQAQPVDDEFPEFLSELTFATTRMAHGQSKQIGESLPDFLDRHIG